MVHLGAGRDVLHDDAVPLSSKAARHEGIVPEASHASSEMRWEAEELEQFVK